MSLSKPGERPGEWQVPMPRKAGPEEWSEWLERYEEEVAATGQPLMTEEQVVSRFGRNVQMVPLKVRGAGGPPLWAVHHAARGVKAVEAWLQAEGFAVRRAAREEELREIAASLPTPGHLPDLIVGERHAFFVEVRRTSVTSAGRYSRLTGAGELSLTQERVQSFQQVEDATGMPVFVLFLDEPLRRAYGNWLSELVAPRAVAQGRGRDAVDYPLVRRDRQRGGEVVCFPYPAAFRPLGSVASARSFRLRRDRSSEDIRLSGHPDF